MRRQDFYRKVILEGLTGLEFSKESKLVTGQNHYWHGACLTISNWESELRDIIQTENREKSISQRNRLKYQIRHILKLDKGIVNEADNIIDALHAESQTQLFRAQKAYRDIEFTTDLGKQASKEESSNSAIATLRLREASDPPNADHTDTRETCQEEAYASLRDKNGPIVSLELQEYWAFGCHLAISLNQRPEHKFSPKEIEEISLRLAGERSLLSSLVKDLLLEPEFQHLTTQNEAETETERRQTLLSKLKLSTTPYRFKQEKALIDGFLGLPATQDEVSECHAAMQDLIVTSNSNAIPVQQERTRGANWWLACVMSATSASVAAVVSLTVANPNSVCRLLNLCSLSKVQEVLLKANEAGLQMQNADNFQSYKSAAKILEKHLMSLRSNRFSTENKAEIKRLSLLSQASQLAILEEESAQRDLARAKDAINTAFTLSKVEQSKHIEEAREALQVIPGRSFASEQAKQLMEQLVELSINANQKSPKHNQVPEKSSGHAGEMPQSLQRSQPQGDSGESDRKQWRPKPLF